MSDRQLIADLLSALEYHTEQTRPIEFSKVAIEAAREYLSKPAQQQEPLTDEQIEKLDCVCLLWDGEESCTIMGIKEFARAIEAAHGIKEKING